MAKRHALEKDQTSSKRRPLPPVTKSTTAPAQHLYQAPGSGFAGPESASLSPRAVLQLQRAIGNQAVGRLIGLRDPLPSVQKQTAAGKQGREAAGPVRRRLTAGTMLQLMYLWDRNEEDEPHWSDKEKPPAGYLASGRYDDGDHGEDDLYARMGSADLFYGISYEEDSDFEEFLGKLGEIAGEEGLDIETPEGFTAVLKKYEEDVSPPMLEVGAYKALYGGSSGWDRYTDYLEGNTYRGWAEAVRKFNPGLAWSDQAAGFACQIAMITAIVNKGSVRFLLDGMKDVKGVIEGTAYTGNVTSKELQFTVGILGKTISLGKDSEVKPVDGVNVFFYLNHQLVPADQLDAIGKD
jgi:hypothetical protein